MAKPTYSKYRSYGHGPMSAFVLSSGYWLIAIAVIVGILIGMFA